MGFRETQTDIVMPEESSSRRALSRPQYLRCLRHQGPITPSRNKLVNDRFAHEVSRLRQGLSYFRTYFLILDENQIQL